ncbi:hypothetical protein [Deinococcus wulumuqiensis]|uniref:Uncharacterized protein n=1 Tax=Deinococcus wulumuqiensis TaxID=980427 RepID=A0AAV4K796_9DEIO|nr:hypothetical protein [Deinococcus wulumuqiensis]QII20216.1 hypothetical protein G6R31_05105 [Deinococcus wulumuqiensis R12]GGI75098.1 hypothetical protein GCM10010914_06650 [Deinococcus wulumuqiensis]GGP28681.1 hypothetical protein GCM10008021_03320 [Deinococcus wulumuqiensis]
MTRNDRRKAAQTISSLGAVVSLSELEERAEVLLPFGDDGKVLRGMYRGMGVRAAEEMEVGHLLRRHTYVRRSVVTLRPWWRWWLNTRAVRLLAFDAVEVQPD